jgi:hypothetical protein
VVDVPENQPGGVISRHLPSLAFGGVAC